MLNQLQILHHAHCELGEGPMWHPTEKCLYWVDILDKKLHRFDPNLGAYQSFSFNKMLGAVVPTNSHFHLLVSLEDGVALFNTHTHELDYWVKFHQKQPNMRANDGKCDPFGNFWVGTMDKTCQPEAGALYCFSKNKTFRKRVKNITISNGLAWTAEKKTMYYIDTMTDVVKSYKITEGGILRDEKVVIKGNYNELGYLDGMTIDTEGMLWIAHCNGGCIRRWNPHTGEILATIPLPVPKVTSLTFGGDNYDTLFITTAQEHLTSEERQKYPLSGATFFVKTVFRGLETHSFNFSNIRGT
jgi:sugar lactone lactonase YvrE